MLHTLVEIVHVLVAFFMILVVLVQGGNQGGVGAAFGGGNSSGVFGATGATTLLGKMTYVGAFVFMLTSISLTMIQGKTGDIGLRDKLKQTSESAPATQPAGTAPATSPVDAAPATSPVDAAPALAPAAVEPAPVAAPATPAGSGT